MTSSVQAAINEMNLLKLEIKRHIDAMSILKARTKVLETEIVDFLKIKDQSGLKYKNQNIVLTETSKVSRKPKKNQVSDLRIWLQNKGITNLDQACLDVMQIQKGSVTKVKKLLIS